MTQQSVARVEATFDSIDDLFWEARSGGLLARGPIVLCHSGRIGPLMEAMLARNVVPEAYRGVSIEVPFVALVGAAIEEGRITGNRHIDGMGVFPLCRHSPGSDSRPHWDQWAHRAENAAQDG